MLSVLFLQDCLFGNPGHYVHSFGCRIEIDNTLHIIKHLSTLDNTFVTESLLENCIKTIHVLVSETE